MRTNLKTHARGIKFSRLGGESHRFFGFKEAKCEKKRLFSKMRIVKVGLIERIIVFARPFQIQPRHG